MGKWTIEDENEVIHTVSECIKNGKTLTDALQTAGEKVNRSLTAVRQRYFNELQKRLDSDVLDQIKQNKGRYIRTSGNNKQIRMSHKQKMRETTISEAKGIASLILSNRNGETPIEHIESRNDRLKENIDNIKELLYLYQKESDDEMQYNLMMDIKHKLWLCELDTLVVDEMLASIKEKKDKKVNDKTDRQSKEGGYFFNER